MSIAEKLTAIAENEEKVYKAGKDAEWNAFWDSHQANGNKKTYNSAFVRWNEDVFYPKYDMIPSTVSSMFQNFNIDQSEPLDFKARLEDCGVVIDFSSTTGVLSYVFYAANISHLPELNFAKAGQFNGTFSYSKVETIDKLIVSSGNTFANPFNQCYNLKNIVVEGEIAAGGLDFTYSPLTKESIISIINALSDTTSGLSITIPGGAVQTEFETPELPGEGSLSEEWLSLVATKPNWTISLN